jgi:uncharacterized protein YlaI
MKKVKCVICGINLLSDDAEWIGKGTKIDPIQSYCENCLPKGENDMLKPGTKEWKQRDLARTIATMPNLLKTKKKILARYLEKYPTEVKFIGFYKKQISEIEAFIERHTA